MKLSPKAKSELISYARSVGVATVTAILAIVADMNPAYAIALGSIVAPIVKFLDPTYKGLGVNKDVQ